MKLIVGLGNPGLKYERTRHNIGFLAMDVLARALDVNIQQSKWKGLYGEGHIAGEKIILLKPMTYMNLSGESIRPLIDFFNIPIDDILIIYDDLDLPFGTIKLRYKGSSGGHNGLKSIIAQLGTEQFKRIKMGISRPEGGDVISYVLGNFSKEDQGTLDEMLQKAVAASIAFVKEKDFSKVMNMYNG